MKVMTNPGVVLCALVLMSGPLSAQKEAPSSDAAPCSADAVRQSCRDRFLDEALESLFEQLRDPYSAKLDSLVIVTREPAPVVCGFVNAKNAYGAYAGREAFVYSVGTLMQTVFPGKAKLDIANEGSLEALKRCTAAEPEDFMPVPDKYRKYVAE